MSASPFASLNAAPAGPQDYNKLFKAEREHLEFANSVYSWVGDGVEDRVLRRYGRKS
jgi:ER membrane protein complex subunit 3